MAVDRIILDGAQAYGVTVGASGVITINGIAYKVNSVTPNRQTQEAKDYAPDGTRGRRRETEDWDTCDLELQLATSSTACPAFGKTFAMTIDANYGLETWVVSAVSPSQSNSAGEIRTVTIHCTIVESSITTVA